MSQDRFTLNLQPGKNADETAERCMQELIRLVGLLNQASIPVVVGPNDNLPEGLNVNQVVIDWSSGISVVKVWNGAALV